MIPSVVYLFAGLICVATPSPWTETANERTKPSTSTASTTLRIEIYWANIVRKNLINTLSIKDIPVKLFSIG
jgi:hypothetical protein